MSIISRPYIVAWICAIILAHVSGADFNPLSASSIEPTADFSFEFRSAAHKVQLQNDIFSTLRVQRERQLFHQKIMSDESIQVLSSETTPPTAVFGDSLHVRFTAFDETFDIELQVDRHSIDSRTRIIAGVPGDETVYRPQLVTYTATTVDAHGAVVLASFTVMHDKRIRGIIVRGGEIYQVAPLDHLDADLAPAPGPVQVQDAALASLRARAAASSDMVVYKLSDIRTTDDAGQPQVFCGAVDPETGHSHDDPIAAPASAPAPVISSTAAGVARQPLLKRWTDCHSKAAGYGIKVYVDYMVDIGAALHYSGSSSTVSPSTVWTRMAEVQAAMNVFYTGQLATTLTFNTMILRTGSTSERWNVYAFDDARKSSIDQDGYLDAACEYRNVTMADADKGASMQFITRSFSSGVVGMAYVGVLRQKLNSIGFSSIYRDSGFLLTVSHEIAHNFNARHSFDTCVGEYVEDKGGIMDYSNGILGPNSDSEGEVGFHSVCSKREMCPHVAQRYSTSSSYYLPFEQCFADINAAPVPVCGDGVVEGDEECDLYGTDTACCVGCRLVAGATCAIPGTCCVGCQQQPATTACGTEGFCGAAGVCETTRCSQFGNTEYCGGPQSNSPCQEKCYYDEATTCTPSSFLIISGRPCTAAGGVAGICDSTTCVAATYDWAAPEAFPSCSCDADEVAPLSRAVRCVDSAGAVVAESLCDASAKPQETQACCNYAWTTSSWSTCTTSAGTQTRTATCRNTDRGANVPDSYCTDTKPQTSRPCSSQFIWTCAAAGASSAARAAAPGCSAAASDTTGYGTCAVSGPCGSGTQTRAVSCVSNGQVVSDSSCTGTRPAESSACEVACFNWRCAAASTSNSAFASAPTCAAEPEAGWGACTVACSSASQARAVKCWSSTTGAVVNDSSCSEVDKPDASRTCTAPTTISGITVSPASPTAGQTVTVSWSCYYGTAQQVQVALGSTALGIAGAGAKSASGTLPVSGAKTVTFDIIAADGTRFTSPSVSIKSRCDTNPCGSHGSCTAATGKCACDAGYSGDTCSVSACDKCEASLSTCTPSEGVCHCDDGWSGATCAQATDCDQSKCQNGGYITKVGNTCKLTCNCRGNWAGNACETCSLSCGSGASDAGCDKCVCKRGYSGSSCGCRGAYGVLFFASLSDPSLDALADAVAADVATVSGADLAQVSIAEITRRGDGARVVVMLSVCGVTSSPFAAAALSSMADVYAGWDAVHASVATNSLMANGNAAALGGDVSVTTMYDPQCTTDCPAGTDPFAAEESSSGSDSTPIIIAVVCGAVALLVIIAVIRKCCRRPKEEASTGAANKPAAELAPMPTAAPTYREQVYAAPGSPTSQYPPQQSYGYSQPAAAQKMPPPAYTPAQAPPMPARPPVPARQQPQPQPQQTYGYPQVQQQQQAPAARAVPPPAHSSGLPPNWIACTTDDGQHRYYWNTQTQQSSWTVPTA